MARNTLFVVVSYDIPDDARRTKVCNALKDFGQHVQYSVFECDLKPRDMLRMANRLVKLINKDEDSVRFYYLCEGCVPKVKTLGADTVERLKDFYLL
jgi:CRISPR-associated protein Cas2